MGFINWANNVCHIPVFEDWVYYNFWFWAWWWGPLLGSLITLHDIVTGFFFRSVRHKQHIFMPS
jgi:hypothetical protein